MSKTRLLQHIVFATKHRKLTIPQAHKKELYAYIYGITKNYNCYLHRINGMPDHVHMLVDVHPTIAVATLVKNVKQWSSHWLKQSANFPDFAGWSNGYYAVSLGIERLEFCKNYIINQELHHSLNDLMSEMSEMAATNCLSWHEGDWE